MKTKLLLRRVVGDTVVRYDLPAAGRGAPQLSLHPKALAPVKHRDILPPSVEIAGVPARWQPFPAWQPDSLVQLKCAEDHYGGAFAGGLLRPDQTMVFRAGRGYPELFGRHHLCGPHRKRRCARQELLVHLSRSAARSVTVGACHSNGSGGHRPPLQPGLGAPVTPQPRPPRAGSGTPE